MPFDTAQIKKPLPEAYAEGGGCLRSRLLISLGICHMMNGRCMSHRLSPSCMRMCLFAEVKIPST